jgi:hypothetical protein
MTISIGCAIFFIFAIYAAGMMTMAVLLAGKEVKEDKPPTKVIRISEDIDDSIIHTNVPDWKKAIEN